MAHARASRRPSQLWQLPLLLFSFALFAYAAYLFIDPRPGPSLAQKIDAARRLLEQERAEAAFEACNALLTGGEKLPPLQEGAVRMLLAEAVVMVQRQRGLDLAANHRTIIEQTRRAIELGIEADAAATRRLAESHEALGRTADALAHYRKLVTLDPPLALRWERKVIDLLLRRDEPEEAEAALRAYLKRAELAASERAWALGELARLLVDRGRLVEARQALDEALKVDGAEPTDQGRFHYWTGYAAWRQGDVETAEKHLRVARDRLRSQHPLDAEAAYALGRISHDRKDHATANSFYVEVLANHPDARVAPLAKLGRGVCRVAIGQEEAGLSDLEDLVRGVREREAEGDGVRAAAAPAVKISERFRDELVAGLREASALLAGRGNVDGALEVMAHEQELLEKPPAEFFGRLGRLYEQQGDRLDRAAADARPAAEGAALRARAREAWARAGDAYTAYAMALTLADDRGYGQALWRGIGLYDRAGDLARTITALETFTAERPDDALAPDATLRLGQALHAAGLFDRAIAAYRHNLFRYPKSLAASKSGVPLARAYLAKGPEFYARAEEVLRSVIEDNPQITPDAAEFRESLFELADLYYRTGRYELAVARLEEMTQRYPEDPRLGQLLFLMADSYRKSAALLESQVIDAASPQPPAVDVADARRQRQARLARARDLYGAVIAHYKDSPPPQELRPPAAAGGGSAAAGAAGPPRDLDRLYLKLAHFYRADCVFDLGDYAEAIRLYGEAAFRYQDDPSALAAYVQIVNANVALGRLDEARAANERARTMLRRMPPEAFSDAAGGGGGGGGGDSFGMPRHYWEQWLKWSGEAGIWK